MIECEGVWVIVIEMVKCIQMSDNVLTRTLSSNNVFLTSDIYIGRVACVGWTPLTIPDCQPSVNYSNIGLLVTSYSNLVISHIYSSVLTRLTLWHSHEIQWLYQTRCHQVTCHRSSYEKHLSRQTSTKIL